MSTEEGKVLTVFEEAMKKIEEGKARDERKRAGGFDFEDIQKMFLHFGEKTRTERVFRIYGNPLEMRKNNSDPKLIYFSRIVKDGGKSFTNIIWKTKLNDIGVPEIDEDWILYRLYKKVMEADWRNYTDDEKKERNDNKRGEYIPRHSGTKSFARINQNRRTQDTNTKIKVSFYPKKRVILNVIDRMDNWCVENKHSKILMASGSPYEFTNDKGEKVVINYVNDIGIPYLAYTLIFENVVKFHHGWDIDIVAKATGELSHAYEIRDVTETKISELSKKVGKDGPMTAEELAYELYDIDKLYREASYTKLYKNLIGLFKLVDSDFPPSSPGEGFTEELTKLYNEEAQKLLEEKKRREAEGKAEEGQEEEHDVDAQEQEDEQAPAPAPEPEAKQERKERASRETKAPEVDYLKAFPNWNKIDQDDRDDVIKFFDHFEDSVPKWKEGTTLAPCDNDKCCFLGTKIPTSLPSTVLNCPVCGIHFKTQQ